MDAPSAGFPEIGGVVVVVDVDVVRDRMVIQRFTSGLN